MTVLVAARDEEGRIGEAVRSLREALPGVRVLVADDGSRDGTAAEADEAGATVLRLERRGKGEALTAAEREAPSGALLLVDADVRGPVFRLAEGSAADLEIAAFERRAGGGFGLAKAVARRLIRLRSGYDAVEPLSGQRYLSPAARAACFPLAPGFGCETRMTIDATRAGLVVRERMLDLTHRATGRDASGFAHRGRQLADVLLACGPLAVNFRGRRLPLVGWAVPAAGAGAGAAGALAVGAVAAVGLADDFWSGSERGLRAHLLAGRTTGMLKLVAVPAIGLAATRSLSGAALVALAANALNQLDTRPGRALKAFLIASAAAGPAARRWIPGAVLLLPYDLRERVMLGDTGSNALGAVVGLSLVASLRGRARYAAIAALAGLNAVGEQRSLGGMIERTPVLRDLDRLGGLPR